VFALDHDDVLRAAVIVGPYVDVHVSSSERDVLLALHLVAAFGENLSDPSL